MGAAVLASLLAGRASFAEAWDDGAGSKGTVSLPAGVRVTRDVPYGTDPEQCFDVYSPAGAKGAPVIFMVHGGAWFLGDKGAQGVVQNKAARWVTKGFVLISANYRLMPKADPLEQAKDVARAIAAAQEKAASWGGDRSKFILMGHSAGAHLVALVATTPALSAGIVTTPWLGTVSLDSAAFDVAEIMGSFHPGFFDRAFGKDPAYWKSTSPFYSLSAGARPFLAVCSSRRFRSCPEAKKFSEKAASLGVKASVLEEDLSHRDINWTLGGDGAYTEAVESFMGGLDGSAAEALRRR